MGSIKSAPEQSIYHFYGGTENGIQVSNEWLQEAFTQSGLSIDNGNTAFNFIDEELLINWKYFFPDSIEIAANEKIEAYWFLKYKSGI